MDLTTICQNDDLPKLVILFRNYPIDQCIKSCIVHDFPNGLRFLLKQSPQCIKSQQVDREQDLHIDHIRTSVQYNRVECVQAFLDHGCDLNGHIGDYKDPPILSVQSIKMAELLISHGADINICKEIPWDDDDFDGGNFAF